MSSETPVWLIAVTIFAPIFASFGVLWLSNKHQSRNLRAQHDLSLEKDKIAAVVLKAEELYSDIKRRKRHFELSGMQLMASFQMCNTREEFLLKITNESQPIEFDLIRLDLGFQAYFPEMESQYREAEKLVHAAGEIQADMLQQFDKSHDEKKDINGRYLTALRAAVRSLDKLSRALALRIGEIMNVKKRGPER